jgi:hypothetical protein
MQNRDSYQVIKGGFGRTEVATFGLRAATASLRDLTEVFSATKKAGITAGLI